jgi:hypothetical protein
MFNLKENRLVRLHWNKLNWYSPNREMGHKERSIHDSCLVSAPLFTTSHRKLPNGTISPQDFKTRANKQGHCPPLAANQLCIQLS